MTARATLLILHVAQSWPYGNNRRAVSILDAGNLAEPCATTVF
jgi:hypothetical protein